MKKWERLAGLILAAVGLTAAIMAYRMGLGMVAAPGPGFFPFWLSLLLTVIAFLYFLGQRGRDASSAPLWPERSWLKPALAAGIMALYAFLLGWLGFFPSTLLLLVIWLAMEGEKPRTTALVGIIGTYGLFLLFALFLQVPLPPGRVPACKHFLESFVNLHQVIISYLH